MPTKYELLDEMTKKKLLRLAKRKKIDIKKSWLKSKIVETMTNSRKLKKADL